MPHNALVAYIFLLFRITVIPLNLFFYEATYNEDDEFHLTSYKAGEHGKALAC